MCWGRALGPSGPSLPSRGYAGRAPGGDQLANTSHEAKGLKLQSSRWAQQCIGVRIERVRRENVPGEFQGRIVEKQRRDNDPLKEENKGKGSKLRRTCGGKRCPKEGTTVTMERYQTPKGSVFRCPECHTLTKR